MDNIPVKKFGKDHWSTLAYIECRVVDQGGRLNNKHLRIDPERHPGLAHIRWEKDSPTYLAKGVLQKKHDDLDCIEDLAVAGFVEILGTGIQPRTDLTDYGWEVASALRKHKGNGGNFAGFVWER